MHQPVERGEGGRKQLYCASCLTKGKPTKIQMCLSCGNYHTTHNFGRESASCATSLLGSPPVYATTPRAADSASLSRFPDEASSSSEDAVPTGASLVPLVAPPTGKLRGPPSVSRTTTLECIEALGVEQASLVLRSPTASSSSAAKAQAAAPAPPKTAYLRPRAPPAPAEEATTAPPCNKRAPPKSPFEATDAASILLAFSMNSSSGVSSHVPLSQPSPSKTGRFSSSLGSSTSSTAGGPHPKRPWPSFSSSPSSFRSRPPPSPATAAAADVLARATTRCRPCPLSPIDGAHANNMNKRRRRTTTLDVTKHQPAMLYA